MKVAAVLLLIFQLFLIAINRKKLVVENYRKRKVFIAGFITNTLTVSTALLSGNAFLTNLAFALALSSAAGVFDDLYGSRERGFKGHLRALLRGKITTGILKIVMIGLSALYISFRLNSNIFYSLVDAVLISLASNFFNLLDLRPGRAIKVSIPFYLLIFLSNESYFQKYFMFVLVFYSVFLIFDLREYIMLGDTGANLVGFLVGVLIVLTVKILILKLAILFLLGVFNLASERISFSEIIERTPLLSKIDRLGRID